MSKVVFDAQKIVDIATEKQISLSWEEAEAILDGNKWLAEDNLIILFTAIIRHFSEKRGAKE